ncbi:aminotransferase class I/II-fold pyridoxal phosphate-dependent enzyme [candidate division KSB1 bacterium]|nr:aminotransferase class I/II-fold pyridoxal phosphate-dependent enzyme [candidate division KSB1 bacterium]
MKLIPFEMERMQSTWENQVEYNLSESGVLPFHLNEFLEADELNNLLNVPISYGYTNGSEELRSLIAGQYENAQAENVLVTNGSSEANFLITWALVEPGDEVVFMLPNYMQIQGLAQMFGAQVKSFFLTEVKGRWQIDWEQLESVVNSHTKFIAICNPNNPTGAQLQPAEIKRIQELASHHGSWIVADEVYRGAEFSGPKTTSFWGNYDRTMVVSGLSKAFSLQGLRTGWIVAPPELIQKLWAYHDYATISPNVLSDRLACFALQPEKQAKIQVRTRKILNQNYTIVNKWLQKYSDIFEWTPPVAGAITLIKNHLNISSQEFADQLRIEKSVLLVPGIQFQMENYFRVGFGGEPAHLRTALDRVGDFVAGRREQRAESREQRV